MARSRTLLQELSFPSSRRIATGRVPLTDEHCDPAAKRRKPLDAATRRRLHRQVPRWRLTARSLTRQWTLRDFDQAFSMVRRLARLAKGEDHHPDIHLESYKRLRLVFTTHAAGGLTRNDFILAAHIDEVAKSFGRPRKRRRPPIDVPLVPFVP